MSDTRQHGKAIRFGDLQEPIQAVADREHGGNFSEAVRALIRRGLDAQPGEFRRVERALYERREG